MRSERGSVTLWTLGLSIILLAFGGLAVDFWRALAFQRELAAVADSMAVAAASGIDEEIYRATGEVTVDPARAESLGHRYVLSQDVDLVSIDVSVAASGSSVSVTLESILDLGLLGLFVDETEPLMIRARASAEPVLVS